MNTYDYHKLLKFLYFEGYASSYKEAEYMIEDMEDDEFNALCEEVLEEPPIIDYLIDEGYADDEDSAAVIFENMSDEWLNDILEDSAYYARR